MKIISKQHKKKEGGEGEDLEEVPGEGLEEEDTALEEGLEEAPALEGQCLALRGVVLGQGKVAAPA